VYGDKMKPVSIILSILTACLGLGACKQELALRDADLAALASLRRVAVAEFKQEHVFVSPLAPEAVVIRLSGQMRARHATEQSSSWIPLVMMREYPKFVGRSRLNDSIPLDLEAYQVEDGLWCIIGRIPASLGHSSSPYSERPADVPITVEFLLISDEFIRSPKFFVPATPRTSGVEISVELPRSAEFASSNVGIVTKQRREILTMAGLPHALTNGRATLVATVTAPANGVWDFSPLRYSIPREANLRWIVTVVMFVIVLPCFIYVALLFLQSLHSWRRYPELEKSKQHLLDDYRHRLESAWQRWGPSEGGGRSPSELAYALEQEHLTDIYRSRLKLFAQGSTRQKLIRRVFILGLLLGLLAIVSLLLVAPIAAQSTMTVPSGTAPDSIPTEQVQSVNTPTPLPMLVLSDLHINVGAPDSNRVSLTLRFYALSETAARSAEIEFRVPGRNSRIESIAVSDSVALVRYSHKSARLRVPVTTASFAGAVLAVDSPAGKIQWRAPDDYDEVIEQGQSITIRLALTGVIDERGLSDGGGFHFFPFDTKKLLVPVRFGHSIVLGGIEISEPSGLIGVASAEPPYLKLSHRRRSLLLVQDQTTPEWFTIAPTQQLLLSARFQRRLLQRVILTVGQLALAITGGFLLGLVAGNAPRRLDVVLEGLGVIAAPLLVWNTVRDRYDYLPTIFAGEGSSWFEIWFLISWLVYAGIALWKWRRTRQPHAV
jgi:hypothetical protein